MLHSSLMIVLYLPLSCCQAPCFFGGRRSVLFCCFVVFCQKLPIAMASFIWTLLVHLPYTSCCQAPFFVGGRRSVRLLSLCPSAGNKILTKKMNLFSLHRCRWFKFRMWVCQIIELCLHFEIWFIVSNFLWMPWMDMSFFSTTILVFFLLRVT